MSPYYQDAKNMIEKARRLAKVPTDYYTIDKFQDRANTLEELEDFLLEDFTLPRGYQKGIFDCSEAAAYLEWALEDAGFDARIVVGLAPWDPMEGNHAWVIVSTWDYDVAIEATKLTGGFIKDLVEVFYYIFTGKAPGVIYYSPNDQTVWNYYNGYTYSFYNIYDVLKDDTVGKIWGKEWNWWEGYWGFL